MKKLLLLITIFSFLSCDWPFNTDTTNDDVFKLNITHSIERIMPTGEVYLSWNEITVENFDKYKIERRRLKDSTWTFVGEIRDPFRLSYIDTITDDDDLTYRVGITDVDEQTKWAENSTTIPKTTQVTIPDEFNKIQDAVESELTDDGDVIFVKQGEYAEAISMHNKDVLIKSDVGYQRTTIVANSTVSIVNMSSGTIDGFTIKDAAAIHSSGGGLFIKGNATIKNCLIKDNFSDYTGGGILMGGDASVYNSIIYANSATSGGNGLIINSGSGEIINNTFVENDIVFTGDCSNLVFRNNIVHNVNPGLLELWNYDTLNFTIDYSLFNYDIEYGVNNIIGDPELIDYESFELSPTSPCIDTGHPDAQYNDINGTRNDIGAYGGPQNEK